MRKLMNLGGNYYQMSLVKEARRMGIYVIDVDYLPNNPAHRFANEYYNVSIADKDDVLRLAKELQIDGIVSFASDIGANTAAFVAEALGLPTNPFTTVNTMTRKDLFHPFLKDQGFVVPEVSTVVTVSDIEAMLDAHKKVIVKPVNSSGSKGISIVEQKRDIIDAFEYAKEYARGGNIVAEEFIEKRGYQVSGDIFVVDGIVRNWGFANGHRDDICNSLVPIGDSFPLVMDHAHLAIMKKEIQRAVTALGYKNGPINVEFIFDKFDRPIIIELGPRSGGGLLADIIYMGSGVDIVSYCIKAALGDDLDAIEDKEIKRFLAAYEFHSNRDGVFSSIDISETITDRILQLDYFVKEGDLVYKCNDSGKALGVAICEFDSANEMLSTIDSMNTYYTVRLRGDSLTS